MATYRRIILVLFLLVIKTQQTVATKSPSHSPSRAPTTKDSVLLYQTTSATTGGISTGGRTGVNTFCTSNKPTFPPTITCVSTFAVIGITGETLYSGTPPPTSPAFSPLTPVFTLSPTGTITNLNTPWSYLFDGTHGLSVTLASVGLGHTFWWGMTSSGLDTTCNSGGTDWESGGTSGGTSPAGVSGTHWAYVQTRQNCNNLSY